MSVVITLRLPPKRRAATLLHDSGLCSTYAEALICPHVCPRQLVSYSQCTAWGDLTQAPPNCDIPVTGVLPVAQHAQQLAAACGGGAP